MPQNKLNELRAMLEADADKPHCVLLPVDTTLEIHQRLTAIAEAEGVTLNDLVNSALRRIILRDAIRADVHAWLDGLDGQTFELTEEERARLIAPPESLKRCTEH